MVRIAEEVIHVLQTWGLPVGPYWNVFRTVPGNDRTTPKNLFEFRQQCRAGEDSCLAQQTQLAFMQMTIETFQSKTAWPLMKIVTCSSVGSMERLYKPIHGHPQGGKHYSLHIELFMWLFLPLQISTWRFKANPSIHQSIHHSIFFFSWNGSMTM